MKIRTQDAQMYIEFGEAFIGQFNDRIAVYIKTRFSREPVLAGVYEDAERARGVLYEIGLAHQNRERVFYMPAA